MIVHTRYPIASHREFRDPKPNGTGGYYWGQYEIPAHAVAWIDHESKRAVPSRERTLIDKVLGALDTMGGSVRSKQELYKAIGGDRTKLFQAISEAESRGLVRFDGRRVIIVDQA